MVGQSEKYQQALSIWTMASYYLKLVEAVIEETISQGNKCAVSIEDWHNYDWGKYDLETKWSDFNIIVPVIYNFYHGLELALKGFVMLKENNEIILDHDIEKLFDRFGKEYTKEYDIIAIIKKYISPNSLTEPLKTFFQENHISTNKFYLALRYPYDKKLINSISHFRLKYKGEEGIEFFKTLKSDISNLHKMFVKLGHKCNMDS